MLQYKQVRVENNEIKSQHFSRMRTTLLPTVRVSLATTWCRYWLGVGGVGPEVNKFEQVSSDDHQMSVAGMG